jgi:hypothetical protein
MCNEPEGRSALVDTSKLTKAPQTVNVAARARDLPATIWLTFGFTLPRIILCWEVQAVSAVQNCHLAATLARFCYGVYIF